MRVLVLAAAAAAAAAVEVEVAAVPAVDADAVLDRALELVKEEKRFVALELLREHAAAAPADAELPWAFHVTLARLAGTHRMCELCATHYERAFELLGGAPDADLAGEFERSLLWCHLRNREHAVRIKAPETLLDAEAQAREPAGEPLPAEERFLVYDSSWGGMNNQLQALEAVTAWCAILNRTLVLPKFEYRAEGQLLPEVPAFLDRYVDLAVLRERIRVITQREFLERHGPRIKHVYCFLQYPDTYQNRCPLDWYRTNMVIESVTALNVSHAHFTPRNVSRWFGPVKDQVLAFNVMWGMFEYVDDAAHPYSLDRIRQYVRPSYEVGLAAGAFMRTHGLNAEPFTCMLFRRREFEQACQAWTNNQTECFPDARDAVDRLGWIMQHTDTSRLFLMTDTLVGGEIDMIRAKVPGMIQYANCVMVPEPAEHYFCHMVEMSVCAHAEYFFSNKYSSIHATVTEERRIMGKLDATVYTL